MRKLLGEISHSASPIILSSWGQYVSHTLEHLKLRRLRFVYVLVGFFTCNMKAIPSTYKCTSGWSCNTVRPSQQEPGWPSKAAMGAGVAAVLQPSSRHCVRHSTFVRAHAVRVQKPQLLLLLLLPWCCCTRAPSAVSDHLITCLRQGHVTHSVRSWSHSRSVLAQPSGMFQANYPAADLLGYPWRASAV